MVLKFENQAQIIINEEIEIEIEIENRNRNSKIV
jgi:hypothetical protein